jgi:hypothetical protein
VASEVFARRLRSELIAMMRVSLRGVDYTAKACASRRAEIALRAVGEMKDLESIRKSILATVEELREAREYKGYLKRLCEAVLTIAANLSSVCDCASDVSSHIVALGRDGMEQRPQNLMVLSACISRPLRLCIVAFVNKDVACAQSALRQMNEYRRIATRNWEAQTDVPIDASHWRDQSIAMDLKKMREGVRNIALQLTMYRSELLLIRRALPTIEQPEKERMLTNEPAV